jgi:AcrR family transcriptional regulator
MGLRDDKKAATRAAIMETALARFRSVGFDRTRVHDVVDDLRLSEATFFNYFPSKLSVLEAVADTMLNRSLELLREELVDEHGPIEERLERLSGGFASIFAGDLELATLLARHTRFLYVASDRSGEGHEMMTRLFADGQAKGEVRDDVPAAQLADITLAASLVTINSWIDDHDPAVPLNERLLAAHRVFWQGARDPNRSSASRGGGEMTLEHGVEMAQFATP